VNIFNRLLIILLAILVLVAAVAVLLTTLGIIQPGTLAPESWFADRLVPFTQLDPTNRTWAIVVSVALVVLALLLLILELRQGQRAEPHLILKDDGSGRVTVALTSVRELVERDARQVAGVERCRARVEQSPKGLSITCRISADTASSVPDLSRELQERLKAAVEHYVGLTVTQVALDVQVPPLPQRRRVQ
jgi:hypothetical protein